MIDLYEVAEAIRNAYDKHQQQKHGRGPLTPWDEIPESRKQKWLDMAAAAVEVINS